MFFLPFNVRAKTDTIQSYPGKLQLIKILLLWACLDILSLHDILWTITTVQRKCLINVSCRLN